MQDAQKLKSRDIASVPVLSPATATSVMLGQGFQIDEYLDEIRKSLLTKAMQQASGVKVKAAGLLGMKHYQTLDAQLKRLGIE